MWHHYARRCPRQNKKQLLWHYKIQISAKEVKKWPENESVILPPTMWHHYARHCPRQHKKHSILATTTTCSWVLHRKHSENTQEYNWIHKNTQEYFELARILKSTQENMRIHKIHSRIHNNTWETSNSANLLEPTLGQCIVLALKPEQLSPLLACFCFDINIKARFSMLDIFFFVQSRIYLFRC